MCSKLSRKLGILCRVKFNLHQETLSMLYTVIVLPLFAFGDVLYCKCKVIPLMCLVYKCRKELVPQYLAETFSNVSDKQ